MVNTRHAFKVSFGNQPSKGRNLVSSGDIAVRFSFQDQLDSINTGQIMDKKFQVEKKEEKYEQKSFPVRYKQDKNLKKSKKELFSKLLKLSTKFGKKSIKGLIYSLKKIRNKKYLSKYRSRSKQTPNKSNPRKFNKKKSRYLFEDDLLFLPHSSQFKRKIRKRNFKMTKLLKDETSRNIIYEPANKENSILTHSIERSPISVQKITTENISDIFNDSKIFLGSNSAAVLRMYEGKNKETSGQTTEMNAQRMNKDSMHQTNGEFDKKEKYKAFVSGIVEKSSNKDRINTQLNRTEKHEKYGNFLSGVVRKNISDKGDDWKVKNY